MYHSMPVLARLYKIASYVTYTLCVLPIAKLGDLCYYGTIKGEPADFYGGLVMKQDICDWMGVADSLIRERLFAKLADILEKDYDHVYDLWLST